MVYWVYLTISLDKPSLRPESLHFFFRYIQRQYQSIVYMFGIIHQAGRHLCRWWTVCVRSVWDWTDRRDSCTDRWPNIVHCGAEVASTPPDSDVECRQPIVARRQTGDQSASTHLRPASRPSPRWRHRPRQRRRSAADAAAPTGTSSHAASPSPVTHHATTSSSFHYQPGHWQSASSRPRGPSHHCSRIRQHSWVSSGTDQPDTAAES